MDLSIIIVNYNQKNLLKQCGQNILDIKPNLDYEIIVIDNSSSDSSQEMLQNMISLGGPPSSADRQTSADARFCSFAHPPTGGLRFIQNRRNLGFAKAVNQGIKLAQGKYVLILNPDIIVLPGSIETIYQFMENNPRCAVAGPQLLNPNKTVQYSACRFPKWYTPILRRTFLGRFGWGKKHLRYYLMMDWNHQNNQEVDWLLGAALMVRREAIKQVGPMDEKFFLYFEDVDWCRRFYQSHWQVWYVAKAKMYHFHQRLSAEQGGPLALFKKITWIHIMSALKYFLG